MAGLLFFVTGVDQEGANRLFKKALPVLKKYKAPVDDANTVVPLSANVLNGEGELAGTGFSPITFNFPAFDALRESPEKLLQFARELQDVLGIPCHASDAPVIAGFRPRD